MKRPAPRLFVLVLALVALACGGSRGSPPRTANTEVDLAQPENSRAPGDEIASGSRGSAGGNQPTSRMIPVDSDDAVLGSALAPVTLVIFTDFQCPFCSRAHPTVDELIRSYGHDKLRVVFKHNPLPFHKDAMPAALAAHAVQQMAGPQAFFSYVNLLFENQRALTDDNLERWAGQVGARNVTRAAASPEVRAKIERDMALATSLGLGGTPSFMINGQRVVGAQSVDKFREIIDAELKEAALLRRSGVAENEVYARRVEENRGKEPPDNDRPSPTPPPAPDTTVWKVPVGKSPTKGPADALVTVVAFLDFQCPFCKKSQATLTELQTRYGTKLRVVFKHNPLPFHPRAFPAAIFALEARAQKGDKGFWEASKLLFERFPKLEEDDLLGYADELKLNKARLKASLKAQRYKKNIEEDQDLAADIEARGTPAFFVNGRKLNGAVPIGDFTKLIDSELSRAESKVKAGTKANQVYAATIKDGKSGGSFEVKTVSAPTKDNPSRGAGKAPVTIQMWSDFQCPFCKRVNTTIQEIEKLYGWKVRVVWRNMPLPFHQDARLAAAAAMEAQEQGGSKAFWKMHELLFAAQGTPDGLKRAALEQYAQKIGLDAKKFADALDSRKHEAQIQSDENAGKAAGLSGTPAFIINGYYLSGAQPTRAFKRVVERALEDSKLGRKAAP